MAQEGVAAALQLDDKILRDLETAQEYLVNMEGAASSLAKSVSSVDTSVKSMTSTLKGAGATFDAAFDETGALKSLSVLMGTVEKVGQSATNTGNKIDKAFERVEQRVEKTKRKIAGGEVNLAKAMGLGEDSIAGIRSKISAIERASEKLRMSLGQKWADVNLKDAGLNIDRLNDKLVYAQSALNMTSRAASKLGTILAQTFSVVMVSRFVSNVVKIRGEFEMSERSLAILLKDAAQARDIFSQIQAIAVKSPFQVKDLVKQTKQLAAYRIESDKLVETSKMLGDISAGLGADMQRLILAYGQVKAATYLKGTELRQFSEAGVNLLGGLAERFSEIQDRAVTTGEVLQMVSKRMVSFKDVDAVLRQQTAAGGTFYKMQEQQAATIQGRISNIRDKLDIMFNEIGKSSQGLIVKILDGIDNIIKNYEIFEALLVSGTVYASVLAIFGGLTKIGGALKIIKAALKTIKADGLIATITSSLGIGGPILAGLLAIGAAIAVIIVHANRLRNELKKMAKESAAETEEQIMQFERLAGVIQDTTKSVEERTKAFDDMKEKFGNLLPLEKENIDTIKKGTEKYNEYAAAIRESNAELLKEKEILAVREASNNAAENSISKIQARFNRLARFENAGIDIPQTIIDKYKLLPEVYRRVQDEILNGTIKDTEEATKKIISMLEEAYGVESGTTEKFFARVQRKNPLEKYISDVFRDKNMISEINESFAASLDFGAAGSVLADQMRKAFSSLYQGDDAQMKLAADKQGRDYYEQFSQAIENSVDQEGNPLEAILNPTQKAALKRKLESYATDLLSPFDKKLYEIFKTVNTQFPNLKEKFGSGDLMLREGETLEQFVKRLKELKNSAQDIVDVFAQIRTQTNLSKEEIISMTEATESYYGRTEEEAKQLVSAASEFVALIGPYLKSVADKAAVAQQKAALKEFLNALKSAGREMDKLDTKGKELYVERLKMLAKNAKVALPVDFNPTTANFKEYEKYLSRLSEEDRIAIQLEWSKNELSNEVDAFSREIKDLWDQYDNAKKMEQWGLTPEDGKSSAQILREIAELEHKLNESDAEDKKKLAKEISDKRQQIVRQEQENVAKLMYDVQKKSLPKVEQAYKEMFENIATFSTWENEEERTTAINDQIAKSLREIADAEWDAYKATEAYALAFGDLEGLSNNVLQKLRDDLTVWLEQPEGSLQPSEIKTIVNAIQKIDERMQDKKIKSYFGAIKAGFDSLSDAKTAFQDIKDIQVQLDPLLEQRATAYKEMMDAAELAAQTGTEEDKQEAERLKGVYEELLEIINALSAALLRAKTAYKASLDGVSKYVDDANQAFNTLKGFIDQTIGLVKEVGDAFGATFSDETSAAIEGFQKGFNLVAGALSLVSSLMVAAKLSALELDVYLKSLLTTMWPLLAVAVALGAVIAVFRAREAALQKEVEKHKDTVERLEKAYDRLEKAMDKALNISKLRTTYAEMNANLERQRQELNEAIAANNQRKQTDEVKKETQEMQDQLAELGDQVDELKDKFYEELGVATDSKNLANDWASDWLSAFKETGSGLKALREDFGDLYDDLVVGQLWSQIMGPHIEELQEMVKKALADGDLSQAEAAAIRSFKNTLAVTNAELEDRAKRLGVNAGVFNENRFQRGVETVTEQTATAVESIVNRVSYDVSDTNVKVGGILDALIGEGENTILSQLKSQTRYLADIARIASAVYFAGGHPKGAGALKVITEMA